MKKLDGLQRDMVRSFAIHQDWQALVEFIEDLLNQPTTTEAANGKTLDLVSDKASGSAAQISGSAAGTEDSGVEAEGSGSEGREAGTAGAAG